MTLPRGTGNRLVHMDGWVFTLSEDSESLYVSRSGKPGHVRMTDSEELGLVLTVVSADGETVRDVRVPNVELAKQVMRLRKGSTLVE